MSFQLYRNTTAGTTLQESLDELIQVDFPFTYFICSQKNVLTPYSALQIMGKFDDAISNILDTEVQNTGNLHTYRYCDNVWTFVLNKAELKDVHVALQMDHLKIVACDGRKNKQVKRKRRAKKHEKEEMSE